jgi:hypothetical protein
VGHMYGSYMGHITRGGGNQQTVTYMKGFMYSCIKGLGTNVLREQSYSS